MMSLMLRTIFNPCQEKPTLPDPWTTMPDGREICSPTPAGAKEYRRRTLAMRTRQGELCRWCGEWMREDETTFDHDKLRGAGRQDDRILVVIDGRELPQNAAVHMLCNGERGSRPQLTRGEAGR